ncbi:MAG: hypothetical protein AB1491_06730 [Thermodesulfobacteriota bacterium]
MIVINHLTRMSRGYICVAGIDLKTGEHIRPTVPRDRLSSRLLTRHGGPFDIGNIINLAEIRPEPDPPHVEDRLISPDKIIFEGVASAEEFWRILRNVSKHKLEDIFGAELKNIGGSNYGTDAGQGQASLGCLLPYDRPKLYVKDQHSDRPQIRMWFKDGQLNVDAPVNDLRLYSEDHFSNDMESLDRVRELIKSSEGIILSLGLTRAWASSAQFEPVHWLQVNNIHLIENPIWQLA